MPVKARIRTSVCKSAYKNTRHASTQKKHAEFGGHPGNGPTRRALRIRVSGNPMQPLRLGRRKFICPGPCTAVRRDLGMTRVRCLQLDITRKLRHSHDVSGGHQQLSSVVADGCQQAGWGRR
eukprot:CAMPEP_0171156036 /NCGR_PEP_ID=MMETSP0790-20130122/1223_1 /TAXON_ID=2925 /ORGANISM="Alexandrium catenella, Strain OF101" /LENGTH=121 /DNA_ID=CAMNT_0011620303 /DNA_START=20 /DNA_END=382 /DNA_ORIENTATION=+